MYWWGSLKVPSIPSGITDWLWLIHYHGIPIPYLNTANAIPHSVFVTLLRETSVWLFPLWATRHTDYHCWWCLHLSNWTLGTGLSSACWSPQAIYMVCGKQGPLKYSAMNKSVSFSFPKHSSSLSLLLHFWPFWPFQTWTRHRVTEPLNPRKHVWLVMGSSWDLFSTWDKDTPHSHWWQETKELREYFL